MKALFLTTFLIALCYAQVPAVRPQVVGRAVQEGQVTTVYLAPRFATAIRMPDAVNSVVLGDPDSFSAEHSEKEPQIVFVKPITTKAAQTNLLISTAHGLMPPQIQLAGKVKKGAIVKHKVWSNSEQLTVEEFRMSRRRLGPGERADGVVVFERPSFKQSNETVLLQMADSGAVDRPALAPIGFGISTLRKEGGE
jgi:hypothetical protein